jgi:hypothetical protein
MKRILSIIVFITALNSQATEFYTAKVLLVSGEVIECKASLPQNKVYETLIKVKKDENKIDSSIKSNAIYQILYTINDNEYLFERTNIGITKKAFKKHRTSNSSGKEWFMVVFSNDLIKAYVSSQFYFFDKRHSVISTHSYEGRNINFGTSFLLKRPNEEAPTVISMFSLSHSKFRKWASSYFKETPELVSRIKNKEFKNSQVYSVALAYSSYQEN